ncbi:hypothetical protein Cgig2_015865 [Carnegiea gigantea]|uniref:Uncharacterized protein n=1 Tax=Carnegiea gigantea TaxID=171969 RepID=A0A9Q1JHN5_9CARY|nr:hypothetical protein Cgig2_015865 [Carnegiea gigantea]
MIKYARLLIKVPLDSSFLKHVDFFNEHDVLIRQQCNHCHMFGHEETACRKKGEVRKEWRPVQRMAPTAAQEDNANQSITPGNVLIHTQMKLIHYKAVQIITKKCFFISFVYGLNHEQQRTPLWENRQGGNEVADHELEELSNLLADWSYFSWTNKTIRSRIDGAFINGYWYETFDYTHTPNITQMFAVTTKPKISFQYYEMWSKHKDFWSIINTVTANYAVPISLQTLWKMLMQV